MSTVVASLKQLPTCSVANYAITVGDRVKPCSKQAETSPLREVRAPFEMEVSATKYYGRVDSGIARLTSHVTS